MAYHFRHTDSSIEEAFRRIAREQVERAIASCSDADPDQATHDIRKRCKKVRGLLRIVRSAFVDYGEENAFFRDTARRLSGIRDAKVLAHSYDTLVGRYADQLDRRALASIRSRVTRDAKMGADDQHLVLGEVAARLTEALGRIDRWRLDDDSFHLLRDGVAKTYSRAYRAMAKAHSNGGAEHFHAWRKRSKYHWYHVRLLKPIWKASFKARAREVKRLGELLGHHHDLQVFGATLRDAPQRYGRREDIDIMLSLINSRQASLEIESLSPGKRIFADKADALVKRWEKYWYAWKEDRANGRDRAS